MELQDQLLDTLRINHRITLYVLDSLSEEQLAAPLAKGKTVAAQFAHIHNVRLMWLKVVDPSLMENLTKLEPPIARDALRASLMASGEALEAVVSASLASGQRIKGFKPHTAAFVGYLIAHDSFHRAHAELALRQNGTPLDDKTAYGTWEWGSR